MSGVLFVALLAAAAFTLLTCPVTLFLYRKTVGRIIQLSPAHSLSSHPSVAPIRSVPDTETLQRPALLLVAQRRLKELAVVYSAAGLACAAVLTVAFLLEASTKSYTAPVAFLIIFSWPVVLCWNHVAGWNFGMRRRLPYLLYAAALASVWFLTISLNPGGDLRAIPYAFLLANAVPTLLIFCVSSPAIRTIGPCIFSFSLIFFLGAWSTVHVVTGTRSLVLLLSKWTAVLGTSPQGAVTLLVIFSFVAFLPVGLAWMALLILGYARNRFSELSIRLDCIWLIVALVQGVIVCTSTDTSTGRGAALALAAFPAYWLVRTAGLRLVRNSHGQDWESRVSLLYLRRFALRGRTERLFQTVTHLWRPLGNVVLIGGPDLARSTIQPHALLQFLLRRTKLSLISSDHAMEEQIAHLGAIDLDGRSRVTDFLCTESMWQKTVRELMTQQNKVVIADFRGLTADNKGSLYEIGQMVRQVSIERIVILTEGVEGRSLIEQAVSDSWKELTACSPNYQHEPSEMMILDQGDSDSQPASILNHLFSLPGNFQQRGRTAEGQPN